MVDYSQSSDFSKAAVKSVPFSQNTLKPIFVTRHPLIKPDISHLKLQSI